MSIRVMSIVWERPDLDPYERLVMLSLADHADDDGRCYPSIARICARTGMKERGVQNVLKRLGSRGLLNVEIGGGRSGTNVYRIVLNPAPDAPPQAMRPRTGCTTPPHPITENPAPGAPEPSGTVNETSKGPPVGPPSKIHRRKVPLPEGWVPSETNLADAFQAKFSEQEIGHEAEKFRNYHKSHGTRSFDWDAEWRNQLAHASERRGRMAGSQNAKGGRRGSSLATFAARNRSEYQL